MICKLSWRLFSVGAALIAAADAADAAIVYSDTVLARGPEYASTAELTLGQAGTYYVTATDLHWLDAPLGALSFGAFTATAPLKTMTGAGTLEFFYGGQGKVFLQLYARPGDGRSAALIGLQVDDVAVVPLPASLWLLFSALTAAASWIRLQKRTKLAAAYSSIKSVTPIAADSRRVPALRFT